MLHTHATHPLSPQQSEEYERLDQLSSTIMSQAEKNVENLRWETLHGPLHIRRQCSPSNTGANVKITPFKLIKA